MQLGKRVEEKDLLTFYIDCCQGLPSGGIELYSRNSTPLTHLIAGIESDLSSAEVPRQNQDLSLVPQ